MSCMLGQSKGHAQIADLVLPRIISHQYMSQRHPGTQRPVRIQCAGIFRHRLNVRPPGGQVCDFQIMYMARQAKTWILIYNQMALMVLTIGGRVFVKTRNPQMHFISGNLPSSEFETFVLHRRHEYITSKESLIGASVAGASMSGAGSVAVMILCQGELNIYVIGNL